MNRRGSQRIKRRIPCEFDYDGHVYAGIVVDLSAGGMFLQTDTAIDPGSELVLRLRPDRAPEVSVRGRVVRRRFTPAVLASMIRRGVGVYLLNAPPAYFELFGITQQEDAERVWGAVEDWEPRLEEDAAAGPIAIDIQVGALEPPVLTPIAEEPDAARGGAAAEEWAFERGEPQPQGEPKPEVESDEPWESLANDQLPAAPAWAPETLCRADALLIDEGELDDVHALLEALGADPVRHRSAETDGFTGWEQPPRVVVAAARSALRLSVGPNVEAQGIVTIAIVDTASQMLCNMLRRQGFRYVVRRPVHPDALRLLLLRSLFRGRERREAPRVPFGCQIALRLGLLKKPATLLELSRTGCRLLARDWLEPGDRLGLRIAPAVTGNRPLALSGRVVRSERRRGVDPERRVALALRFDRLGDEVRARLEALIAAHAWGPPQLASPGAATPHAPSLGPVARGGAAAPAGSDRPERRRDRRARHREEVLALDLGLQRVRHALLGVDLSRAGLRVEPHPELALGDRVKLAIWDAACVSSLVVEAEVARDYGPQGLLLRFAPLDGEAARELDRILERAPQVETSASAPGRGLVVGELLSSPSA
jgi:Tfp pilus assembly protein PilZ